MGKSISKILLIFAFFTGSAQAHRDRILHIDADGAIRGIPAAFGPVRLIVKRLGSENPSIQLEIGLHRTTLPHCVARMVSSRSINEIQVTGSWYHDATPSMPFYLKLRFFHTGYGASQEFLFNLHNAKLIKATVFEADQSGNGGHPMSLKLPAGCELTMV